MNFEERFLGRVNRLGTSKASAQLKIFLSLMIFGIALAFLMGGIHAETQLGADSYDKKIFDDYTSEKTVSYTDSEIIASDITIASAPTITINTPANTTYGASVTFNITTNIASSNCNLSRDGAANVSMGNTSTTAWNYTNSSMTTGLHSVIFYCSNTSGTTGNSSTVYFTADATVPTVTIITPANTTYNSTSRVLNITTSEAASSCNYSLNGAANVSMGNTSTTAWNKTITAAEGLNNVTFYCWDLYSNLGSNGTRYFTADTTGPVITINIPANISYGSRTITLNVTTSEAASSCNYSLNGAANVTMDNTSTTAWNKTLINMPIGSNNVQFYCSDIMRNVNSTATRYFTIDTTAPTITINTPANTTYGASVTFNVTTSEAAGVCKFSRDGAANVSMGNTSTTAWNYTNSSMTSGAHNVTFYCNDTAGHLANSATRYFTVDITAPTITIATPLNTTYGMSVTFNVSTNEAASLCKYRLDNNSNVTMTNSSTTRWTATNSSMTSGAHNVTFYCNDSYSNLGTANVTFSVDTSVPTVTIVAPANTTFTNTTVLFNVTANDSAILCNYSLDAAANVSMTNTSLTSWSYTKSGLEQGLHSIIFYCSDAYSNLGASSLRYFSVDTVAPVISGIDAVNITNTTAAIVATTNENSTCFAYYGANSSSFSNTTSNNTGLSVSKSLTGLSSGKLYYYTWNCKDLVNNSGNSSVYEFMTIATKLEQVVNGTQKNITVNFTTDGLNETVMQFEVLTNQSVNATINVTQETENPTDANLSVGGLDVYYDIAASGLNSSNIQWIIIKIYYNESNIPSNVLEANLKLYWYNSTSGDWEAIIPGGVDTVNNYVWANTTHFSTYTVGGAETETHHSSGSSSGGLPLASIVYTANLDTTATATATQNMKVNDVVSMAVSGETHSCKLISLTSTSALVEISSTPQRVTLSLGISKAVDLNGDGTNDIELLLNSVSNGIANFTFKKIGTTAQPAATPIVQFPVSSEPSVVPEAASVQKAPVAQPTVPLSTFGGNIFVAVIVIIAVGAAVTIWVLYKTKK